MGVQKRGPGASPEADPGGGPKWGLVGDPSFVPTQAKQP